MRLPLVPGPHDVVRLLERSAGAVESLLDAAPRLGALLDRAEELLERAGAALDDLEATRASADELVRRTDAVVSRAEQSVSRVDDVVSKAGREVDRTGEVVGSATGLVDALEPSLTTLQPTLERLARTTHPEEVDALVSLVDHLPLLADRMEGEVIPIVRSLRTVGPDIHDLLDLTRTLNEFLGAVPGLGRVKKKIDEEQAQNGDD
jgi:hypothetical protein